MLSMLEETGTEQHDADGLAEFLAKAKGADVTLLLRELGPDETRVSVRTSDAVDATAITSRFGGGGHVRRGGCTVRSHATEAAEPGPGGQPRRVGRAAGSGRLTVPGRIVGLDRRARDPVRRRAAAPAHRRALVARGADPGIGHGRAAAAGPLAAGRPQSLAGRGGERGLRQGLAGGPADHHRPRPRGGGAGQHGDLLPAAPLLAPVGETEARIRLLSVLFGVASVVPVYFIARRLGGWLAAGLAAGIFAPDPRTSSTTARRRAATRWRC